MTKHARLSPSSSNRWLACSGSVHAGTGVKRTTNEYAEEGTAAHALLETCLQFGTRPEDHLDVVFHDREPDEDMVNAVGHALDWVNAYLAKHPGSRYSAEQRSQVGLAIGREDCWGTLDIEIDSVHELVTIDYKHGKGVVVEVEDNPQLMLYALGRRAEMKKRYKQHRFVVIQPRARHEDGPVREWVALPEQLDDFQTHAAARAKLTDDLNAPRTAGDHCRWCPAERTCRTLAEYNLKVATQEFDTIDTHPELTMRKPVDMTPEDIGYVLKNKAMIVAWFDAVAGHAFDLARRGTPIPGFKIVTGKEGNRQWSLTDKAQLIKLLIKMTGLPEDEVAPRSPISPAQTEKKLKVLKKTTTLIAGSVTRSPAGLTLAPDNDPRREVKSAVDEFDTLN